MKIVICDDILVEALPIEKYLHEYFLAETCPEIIIVSNYDELLKQDAIDILFLDIELGQDSGTAIAAEFNYKSPNTTIIFFSSHPNYVTESYRVNVAQFFVKPVDQQIFNIELKRILNTITQRNEYIFRTRYGEKILFKKADILFVEAQKRMVSLYLVNQTTFQYYGKISDEEKELGLSFARCHKGYIVNLAQVFSIEKQQIILKPTQTGEPLRLPLGRNYAKNFEQALMHYLAFR